MCIRNTASRFGIVTRILHASIGVGILSQLLIMYGLSYGLFPESEKLPYLLFHKALGTCLLVVGVTFLIWEKLSIKPDFLPMKNWESVLARWNHALLLAASFLMPSSGLLMSLASGRSVSVFGWFTVPAFTQVPGYIPETLHTFHVGFSYCLVIGIILHIGGVLKHHFIYKDHTFRRMFF